MRRSILATACGLSAILVLHSSLLHAEDAGLAGKFKLPFIGSADKQADPSDVDPREYKELRILSRGTSSRAARSAGLESLPIDKMTDASRREAEQILDHLSLFRELPTLEFSVDPRVYSFFLQNPEVAVSIWRALEISEFELTETAPDHYAADSRDGTNGTIQVLFKDDRHHVILCKGKYASPFIGKPIEASAMIHLEKKFSKAPQGEPVALHRARMYVALPSNAVETAAKLISPVTNFIIDRNFQEMSVFLNLMTVAMTKQPGWFERLTTDLKNVKSSQKSALLDLAASVYVDARKQETGGKVSVRVADPDAPLPRIVSGFSRPDPPSSQEAGRTGPRIIPASGTSNAD